MSETATDPAPIADNAPVAEPEAGDAAAPEPVETLVEAPVVPDAPLAATDSIRVTNNLGRALALSVDGVAPERVAIAPGASVAVPAVFWTAWRAQYADADFAGHITGVAVG